MSTQYDSIGSLYDDMKALPAALFEQANVKEAVKLFIRNAKVLDLASGTGSYSFSLLEWGASKVVGVDISKEMVAVAESALNGKVGMRSERVSFQVGDCSKPIQVEGGPFDLVLGAWFLNYAPNGLEMVKMFQNISTNLRPGGHFVGVTPPPSNDPKGLGLNKNQVSQKYGVTSVFIGEVEDGIKSHITGYTSPKRVEFDAYCLRKEVYERCAREGGMNGILEWKKGQIPEDSEDYLGNTPDGFWDEYAAGPSFGLLVLQK